MKNDLLASIGGFDVAVDRPTELVLQSYAIPLADFVAADPAFLPAHLSSIKLVVDRAQAGSISLTEAGLGGD